MAPKKKTRAESRPAEGPSRSVTGQNTVVLEGQLTAPPRRRDLDSGTVLVTLVLRVPGRAGTYTSIPVTVWEPTKEVLGLVEGDVVTVEAALRRRFWADGTGQRMSRLEVEASALRRA